MRQVIFNAKVGQRNNEQKRMNYMSVMKMKLSRDKKNKGQRKANKSESVR